MKPDRPVTRALCGQQNVGADITGDLMEFIRAAERYREAHHLLFMSATDYFHVIKEMGYTKTDAPA